MWSVYISNVILLKYLLNQHKKCHFTRATLYLTSKHEGQLPIQESPIITLLLHSDLYLAPSGCTKVFNHRPDRAERVREKLTEGLMVRTVLPWGQPRTETTLPPTQLPSPTPAKHLRSLYKTVTAALLQGCCDTEGQIRYCSCVYLQHLSKPGWVSISETEVRFRVKVSQVQLCWDVQQASLMKAKQASLVYKNHYDPKDQRLHVTRYLRSILLHLQCQTSRVYWHLAEEKAHPLWKTSSSSEAITIHTRQCQKRMDCTRKTRYEGEQQQQDIQGTVHGNRWK